MNRRKILNKFKVSKWSTQYWLILLVGGIVLSSVALTLTLRELESLVYLLDDPSGHADMSLAIATLVRSVAIYSFVSFFVYMILSFICLFLLSYRIGGPMQVICQYIDDLKNGNLDSKRDLRRTDELQPIMSALKELASSMMKNRS